MLHIVTECEVCHTQQRLRPVMDLGRMPRPDDLRSDAPVYPTEILFCEVCKTAHLRHQLDNVEVFPIDYHYRAGMTKDVQDGMRQLVAAVEGVYGSITGARVLDVGCNDGSLLNYFRDYGAHTFGITPETAAIEARAKGHEVMQAYLGPDVAAMFVAAHGNPDIITFVNVFAHIRQFDRLLESMRWLMCGKTKMVVIENHYLGSVLDRNQFDTFYHEHPRTYSYQSFKTIAARLGMHVEHVEFPARYGGNIRVFMTPGDGADIVFPHENDFGERLERLNANVIRWKHRKQAFLANLKGACAYGPIRAVAFPGRAAILLCLLGLDVEDVSAVYEKEGSQKIGHFAPATRIPIVSETEFNFNDDSPIFNFAWHIPKEIEERWRGMGFKGEILQAVSRGDFL